MSIKKRVFGKMPDGNEVYEFTLTNKNNASVVIITYGGALVSINLPDKNGNFADVICGYDTLEEYIKGDQNQGALIGRYANRIGKGKFTLNGKEYSLALNNGNNHLHGGIIGYNRRLWDAKESSENGKDILELSVFSPDGEEGYPGNLTLKVTYSFDDNNILALDYEATTDKDTVCNFTNHSYFNFGGYQGDDIKNHTARFAAEQITETDSELIPTGNFIDVKGTKYDFLTEKNIEGEYDDNFVLGGDGTVLKFACEVRDTVSGRGCEVYTTQPGIQLYTGNFMDGGIPFKGGVPSRKHHAFCLETQLFPDSPNHPNFTNSVLKPGEVYKSRTEYRFFAK
ncbi:MAG: galactose mutarotase [Clostridia bacterium]|nr:galactose mutarotase [Clostridia bacterium]